VPNTGKGANALDVVRSIADCEHSFDQSTEHGICDKSGRNAYSTDQQAGKYEFRDYFDSAENIICWG
jgi:hypothetical protein